MTSSSGTGLILLFVLFLIVQSFFSRKSKTSGMNQTPMSTILQQKIFERLRERGVPADTARMIVAQAVHETGNFTSELWTLGNNAFGMKLPRRRPTLAIDEGLKVEGDPAASFMTVEDSVDDLLLWLDFNSLPINYSTLEDYISAIRRKGYFTDTYIRYLTAVRRRLEKLEI